MKKLLTLLLYSIPMIIELVVLGLSIAFLITSQGILTLNITNTIVGTIGLLPSIVVLRDGLDYIKETEDRIQKEIERDNFYKWKEQHNKLQKEIEEIENIYDWT